MFGVEVTPEHPIERLVDLARRAESAGYGTVFVSHHYNNRDAFAALAAIADATESVDIGPGVVNPYEAHPVTLASRVGTLAEHSEGRAVYGLGAGDRSTLDNLGIERSCLLALADRDMNTYLSSRNIPSLTVRTAAELNAYEVATRRKMLVTRAAMDALTRGEAQRAAVPAAVAEEAEA